MSTPQTIINKVDGQTGVVKPAATGVLGIACAVLSGSYSAGAFADDSAVKAEYANGHMYEFAKYVMEETKKPVVCVGVDGTTSGAYSALTKTGGGTSAITAGATEPCDEFSVVVDFPAGGTIAAAGITYRTSINGGVTFTKAQALGTATSIVIPNTGITVLLGAGTITTTTKVTFTTTGPKITNADVPGLLEAFRVTSSRYEAVLIDMDADDTTVGLVNSWVLNQNKRGKFPTVVLTARAKNLSTSESESAFATAMATAFAPSASLDALVCADGGEIPNTRGFSQFRPAGLFVAARGMKIPLGQDAAYVNAGPLTNVKITDAKNNAKYHDENLFPGIDDLRLVALRQIDGFDGVYVNNPNLISPTGSDFVYWQHARTMNRGCEIAYAILTRQLSAGVDKNPVPGPNGERYIDEREAQHLEGLVNAQLFTELVGTKQVSDMKCIISRTDDLRSNSGQKVRVQLVSVALAYIKEFDVDASFATSIPSAA